MLEVLGLRFHRLEHDERPTEGVDLRDWLYEMEWRAEPRKEAGAGAAGAGSWLIVGEGGGLGEALAERLRGQGAACVRVGRGARYEGGAGEPVTINPAEPGDFGRVLQEAWGEARAGARGVVHLWSLETTPVELTTGASVQADQALGCGSLLHLTQALAKTGGARLWVVTRGAQAVGGAPVPVAVTQAPVWGLSSVIALEHPELRCRRVDLDPTGGAEEVEALAAELGTLDAEDQVAFRSRERLVRRLVRAGAARPAEARPTVPDEPFQLEIPTRGVLDNLVLRPGSRRPPGRDEVELRVAATGLNFRDVLNTLGLYPGEAGPLGSSVSGRSSPGATRSARWRWASRC